MNIYDVAHWLTGAQYVAIPFGSGFVVRRVKWADAGPWVSLYGSNRWLLPSGKTDDGKPWESFAGNFTPPEAVVESET